MNLYLFKFYRLYPLNFKNINIRYGIEFIKL